jgi:hypothetical protein
VFSNGKAKKTTAVKIPKKEAQNTGRNHFRKSVQLEETLTIKVRERGLGRMLSGGEGKAGDLI